MWIKPLFTYYKFIAGKPMTFNGRMRANATTEDV